jgi:4-amino-4-deoxy-L-arabinose transferase-like glycosyltransferase
MLNQLLGSPVLLFLVLLPLCMAAAAGLRIAGPDNFLHTPLKLAAFGLLSAAVLGHLYFAAYYLSTPNFTDHIEPNTASVAWLYANGGQLFHPVDAAERYAFLYGPLAYIATALSYTLFGASTFTAKLAGFVCLLLAMTTLVWATRRRFSQHWYPAVIALGYFSLLALFFKNHSFWSKPDPFMILGVCISLLACLATNKTRAWIIFGVAAGLVVNAKITGVLYLLPFAAWLFERDGIRAWLVAAVPAFILAALPFLFPESASLSNYIAWLQSAGGHGISRVLLVQNFLFILFASIPVIAFLLWQFIYKRSESLLLKHKLVVIATLAR